MEAENIKRYIEFINRLFSWFFIIGNFTRFPIIYKIFLDNLCLGYILEGKRSVEQKGSGIYTYAFVSKRIKV